MDNALSTCRSPPSGVRARAAKSMRNRARGGKQIKVAVSFTDRAGHADGPLTSAAYPSQGYPAAVIAGSLRGRCPGTASWCSTMTVGYGASGTSSLYGYSSSSGAGLPGGGLELPVVTHQETSYTVVGLFLEDVSVGDDLFHARFDAHLPHNTEELDLGRLLAGPAGGGTRPGMAELSGGGLGMAAAGPSGLTSGPLGTVAGSGSGGLGMASAGSLTAGSGRAAPGWRRPGRRRPGRGRSAAACCRWASGAATR